jgi:hypothetical protein
MSAHVVVIDSTARRATVKTTPSKALADILQEACTKLGLDASQYGLKSVDQFAFSRGASFAILIGHITLVLDTKENR